MRATTKMTNASNILYMSRNFNTLNKASTQLANQQKVMTLGDDPLSANVGIRMNTLVARAQQYVTNLESGISTLNFSYTRLGSAKTQIDSIKTLLTSAANDASSTAETRSSQVTELNEIFSSLVNYGNSSDGTRYIFGGSHTTSAPFEIVNGRYVAYNGNQDAINIVVDGSTKMSTNVTGSDIYGNMTTTITSGDLNPSVNLSTDNSTRLSDLNGGDGVPTGKVVIKYSAYPEGLEVDLTGCDTLEDVKDAIEQQTLDASRALDPQEHTWLDNTNLDWHDMQDRYVKVTANADGTGISLMEYDLGEELPQPTTAEIRKGLTYSGGAWSAGSTGIAEQADGRGETTVFDKANQSGEYNTFQTLSVDDYASNKVAAGLGIRGTASQATVDADGNLRVDSTKNGRICGNDLNPVLSERTLLADLEGYNDGVYTFTNGPKDATLEITETSQDANNVFSNWDLDGVTVGANTGANGELYVHAINRSSDDANPDILIEIYTKPVGKATAADLVATGTYDNSRVGGVVVLEEANASGLSGSVGVVLPTGVGESTVNLSVNYPDALQGSVHVPAFIEESNPDGTSKDSLNIASGWNITGLDKPPAEGYDENHPASTDLDGNVSVNYRYDSESGKMHVELSRPAYGNQPATLIATGSIYVGTGLDSEDAALQSAVSGRVEFTGEPGFESVGGSVYIELPTGAYFSGEDTTVGTSAANPTATTYQLQEDAPAGTVTLGGATKLTSDVAVDTGANGMVLTGDTTFMKGQTFNTDVKLANGVTVRAGEELPYDAVVSKGTRVSTDTLLEGTVLASGQSVNFTSAIPAGTVIPDGSYYTSANGGFPSGGSNILTGSEADGSLKSMTGYEVQATFATIEDLNRAIEELGIYVSSRVSSDGKGLEFTSRLAGAWLTVSEDTDCYEQLGDVNNQLSGLNLNGVVAGSNTDSYGNVYSEVVFYPPNDPMYDNDGNITPVRLVSDDGDVTEVQPGYYIRVYSDKSALEKTYENRDNDSMVAEGFVPFNTELADNWSTQGDVNPFGDGAGLQNGVILQERNGSGVNGMVDLNYYGGREQTTANADGSVNYDPYWNDNITVTQGGLRVDGSDYATIQQADVYDITPGVHTDYNGNIHATITKLADDGDANIDRAEDFQIAFYLDSSNTKITGKSNPYIEVDSTGVVPVYSVNDKGEYLDRNGEILKLDLTDPDYQEKFKANAAVIGTVTISDHENMALLDDGVADGTTDSFVIGTGGLGVSGQEREENVFSTINDAVDALNNNDSGTLHDLLGNAQDDIDRILNAVAMIGSKQDHMELLVERHEDDIVSYTETFTQRVGMDDTALANAVIGYQAATNAYQAAMQVSSTIMQMSLLNYL